MRKQRVTVMKNKEKLISQIIVRTFRKRLKKHLQREGIPDAAELCGRYEERFYSYMQAADMGEQGERFSSYLNIFSGLSAYEILREYGFDEQEGISAYDEMCAGYRKFASFLYKSVDRFSNGYGIVVKSLREDLLGAKSVCWDTEIQRDDGKCFEYEISRCLYFDTCSEHGYPEFCKVFCTHDLYAFGVLGRHAVFERDSSIGEGGEVCHDRILKICK